MHRQSIILAALLALSSPAIGKQLTWYTLPLAGLIELKDGKPSDGAVLAIQNLIEAELSEFKHQYIVSAANRIVYEMSNGSPFCTTVGPQISERDHVGYFVPFLPILPLHLVVRPETRRHLPLKNGVVSFEQLIHSQKLRGVITPTRIYPADLSSLIHEAARDGRISSISSNSLGANLLAMVSYKRFDYTIDYPIVISSVNKSRENPAKLVSIPIAEVTHIGTAGFYCTRNSWGRNIAQKLDLAVRNVASKPEQIIDIYRNANDDATILHYESQIRAFLKERAETETQF
jgi:uncharacterized protein (TIGR02285 family)